MWGICGEYAGSMTLSELFLFMCHNEKKVMCLQCLSILSIVTMLANMVGLSWFILFVWHFSYLFMLAPPVETCFFFKRFLLRSYFLWVVWAGGGGVMLTFLGSVFTGGATFVYPHRKLQKAWVFPRSDGKDWGVTTALRKWWVYEVIDNQNHGEKNHLDMWLKYTNSLTWKLQFSG